jgi:hypothetical protein
MASLALCMAASVSRLMFADSMALICCSSVPIWAVVCSRLCSCAFFRFRAALAAIDQSAGCPFRITTVPVRRVPTILIRGNVLPRDGVLLVHLCHQVSLSLLQHLQLRPQAEDRIFGAVLLLLGGPAAEPSPDARHLVAYVWETETEGSGPRPFPGAVIGEVRLRDARRARRTRRYRWRGR